MSEMSRLAVFVSGSGTNLQAILDACGQTEAKATSLDAKVVLVVSDQPDAYGLKRAAAAGVETVVIEFVGGDRRAYDRKLSKATAKHNVDLVVLAGWMRLLSDEFVANHTAINLHPAKPGAFPGLGAIEKAHSAWQDGRVKSGGVMVHYVPDEGIDSGPVIVSEEILFETGETLEQYTARVHKVEHRLIVEAIRQVITHHR